jgi:SAM-dependent methyltransferase
VEVSEWRDALSSEPNVGGDIVGGDPATFYPDLWRWLVEELELKSVLDVGCGEGQALRYFADLGCEVLGVDGVARDDERIITHDFESGPWESWPVDLVWCSEVVEHIEEQYLSNVLPALTAGKIVALTHAFPEQPGYHHVNCRTPEYWRGVMAARGYFLDQHLTPAARTLALHNTDPWNHFVRSGMIFRRHADA